MGQSAQFPLPTQQFALVFVGNPTHSIINSLADVHSVPRRCTTSTWGSPWHLLAQAKAPAYSAIALQVQQMCLSSSCAIWKVGTVLFDSMTSADPWESSWEGYQIQAIAVWNDLTAPPDLYCWAQSLTRRAESFGGCAATDTHRPKQ